MIRCCHLLRRPKLSEQRRFLLRRWLWSSQPPWFLLAALEMPRVASGHGNCEARPPQCVVVAAEAAAAGAGAMQGVIIAT